MKFELTILTLLVAGSYVGTSDVAYGRKTFQRKYGFQCPPRNCRTKTTASPCTSTTPLPTEECPSLEIKVYDTYVTYTFPNPELPGECLHGEIICGEGEIINRVTCIDGGSSLADCKCIPVTTTTTTTSTTTTTTTTSTEFYPERVIYDELG